MHEGGRKTEKLTNTASLSDTTEIHGRWTDFTGVLKKMARCTILSARNVPFPCRLLTVPSLPAFDYALMYLAQLYYTHFYMIINMNYLHVHISQHFVQTTRA